MIIEQCVEHSNGKRKLEICFFPLEQAGEPDKGTESARSYNSKSIGTQIPGEMLSLLGQLEADESTEKQA